MPLYNGDEISPEDAVKRGLCPECARPLADVIIEDEIARHWPRTPNADATKRIDLMRDWAKKNPRKSAGSGN